MIEVVGFAAAEEDLILAMVERFRQAGFSLAGLARIAKAALPGYDGKVVPRPAGDDIALDILLDTCTPFVVAHELAHVSDIAVRRDESRAHIRGGSSNQWHLAHAMSAEYYANRVACGFATPNDIGRALHSDVAGLRGAVAAGDWAEALVYGALVLGVLHGCGRHDGEPLTLLAITVPAAVAAALTRFRDGADAFFTGYAADAACAAAA